MKPRLFALLAVAFFLAGNATAESEAPQPTPAAQPAAPAPQPTPAPAAQTPAPIARREDEPENLSILQRVAAFATSRKRAAENTAGLQSQLDSLRQSLTERDATITGLQATIAKQEGMLQEIGNWLVENGHSDPSAIAANPAAAFSDAVGNGVAAAVRTIGVPAASVPSPAADGTRVTHAELEEALSQCKSARERQDLLAKHRALIFGKN